MLASLASGIWPLAPKNPLLVTWRPGSMPAVCRAAYWWDNLDLRREAVIAPLAIVLQWSHVLDLLELGSLKGVNWIPFTRRTAGETS